jgi:hypothetical protein
MVQPLRRAHWWIWLALAVGLPALFALAIAARNPEPVNPGLNWEKYK